MQQVHIPNGVQGRSPLWGPGAKPFAGAAGCCRGQGAELLRGSWAEPQQAQIQT
jgi:hypothetical protein